MDQGADADAAQDRGRRPAMNMGRFALLLICVCLAAWILPDFAEARGGGRGGGAWRWRWRSELLPRWWRELRIDSQQPSSVSRPRSPSIARCNLTPVTGKHGSSVSRCDLASFSRRGLSSFSRRNLAPVTGREFLVRRKAQSLAHLKGNCLTGSPASSPPRAAREDYPPSRSRGLKTKRPT